MPVIITGVILLASIAADWRIAMPERICEMNRWHQAPPGCDDPS